MFQEMIREKIMEKVMEHSEHMGLWKLNCANDQIIGKVNWAAPELVNLKTW